MLTLKDIEERIGKYKPIQDSGRGDASLNPGMKLPEPTREAAVLILVIPRDDGPVILFTERTKTLSSHAGQVSFPGGGIEKGDRDCAETALRESAEEIGLVPENARVIGELDEYITRSGYRVTPVVAILENEQGWTPNPNEVDHVFEVPVDYLIANLKEESLTFEGGERRFYGLHWDGMHIWGATGGMLRNFAEAVNDNPSVPPAAFSPPRKKGDAPSAKK